MDEMRYQLDLLKAMNQKLSARERMYRMVCDTSYSAFLYYAFDLDEIVLLGRWKSFFDFEIRHLQEFSRLYDVVDEPYRLTLRNALHPEKSGRREDSCECMLREKRMWLEFRTSVAYDEHGIPTDKIICVSDITKFKLQNEN